MADRYCPARITQVQLKNFRCFESKEIVINNSLCLLEGDNGSGKTSFFEALYYGCYLQSFRASTPKEMIQFNKDTFFIKIHVTNESPNDSSDHDIQIGFSRDKRVVRVNQKSISSYKELMSFYRVVSLCEDDLALIQGAPLLRRTFLDHALLLSNQDYIQKVREFKQVLDNRNAFLYKGASDSATFSILTEQLWEKTARIQADRAQILAEYEADITFILNKHLDQTGIISCSYRPKTTHSASFEEFDRTHQDLYLQEKRYGRSLFGAHLDDMEISFFDKKSKHYASRGQQKLIVLLLKIAQLRHLDAQNHGGIFLLDDFMTDFDPERANLLFDILLALPCQLIFSSPVAGTALSDRLQAHNGQIIQLTG